MSTVHYNSKRKVTIIFEILNKNGKKLENYDGARKRILLFHGTKTENILGNLAKGLLIVPFEAEITGNKYGNGIYLSDSFQKSYDYCSEGNKKYVLLVNTLLDKVFNESKNNQYKSVKELTKKGYNCLINESEYYINLDDNIFLNSGSSKPTKYIQSNSNRYINDYSDYVIYDTKLVNVKYN